MDGKIGKLQQLVRLDNKKRMDDFETKRMQKIIEKKSAKVTKMCKSEAERAAFLAN